MPGIVPSMPSSHRYRLDRAGRLRQAASWLASFRGTDRVRGYRRHFATDLLCAVIELRMLGVAVPQARIDEAQRSARGSRRRPAAPPAAYDKVLDMVADDPVALWLLGEYEALARLYHPSPAF